MDGIFQISDLRSTIPLDLPCYFLQSMVNGWLNSKGEGTTSVPILGANLWTRIRIPLGHCQCR